MYEANAKLVWEKYEGILSGCLSGLWCIFSNGAPGNGTASGNGIPSSGTASGNAETNGSSTSGGIASSTAPDNAAPDNGTLSNAARTAIEKSAAALGYGEASCTFVAQTGSLSAHDVFSIAEGIDPLCVIATDEISARALAGAYGQAVPLDASCRLFGRDAVAFRSFEALLDNASHKQKAWALLKQLPRI